MREYQVKHGETMSSISRKFGCETQRLALANGLKRPQYSIRLGQTLKLEGCRNPPPG